MSPTTAVALDVPMVSMAASNSVLRRPVMNTCAPSSARRAAVARPIPVLLEEGDFYLLGTPPPYVLASTLTAPSRPAKPVWGSARDGVVRIGPEAEEDTYLCGGHFSFEDTNAPALTQVLPLLVLVRAA